MGMNLNYPFYIAKQNIFGPKPKFEKISLKDENGVPYEQQILVQSRDLKGHEILPNKPAGTVIIKDSRTFALEQGLGSKNANKKNDWKKKLTDPVNFSYKHYSILDQNGYPACVGFAWTGRQNLAPFPNAYGNEYAYQLYKDACLIDWFTDNDDFNSGTTTISGAKIVKRRGLITKFYDIGYKSLDNLDALNLTIEWLASKRGPLVLGTIWKKNMSYPNSHGFIEFSGEVVGGHALVISGVKFTSNKNGFFILTNSWGESWGSNGQCYISFDEFRKLLSWYPDIYGVDEVKPK